MEFLTEYGLFLAKAITVVAAVGMVIGIIVSAGTKSRQGSSGGQIDIIDVSESLTELEVELQKEILSKSEYKTYLKEKKKAKKADDKSVASKNAKSRQYVIEFDGDIKASAVENLRQEITAILKVANEQDSVLLKLESPGGMVHGYGLAASQLDRLKQKGIHLTVAVDAVAASGGYMMACVADRIVAAPFAIIGSIGVVGQLPNFNRLLKHHQIDYEQHTAGEFKRTLTVLGENTEEGRTKFRDELEQTHTLFKEFVSQHRPELDLNRVATGEHWYGTQAKELGLVDDIATSDDLILDASRNQAVFKVKYDIKKPLSERLPVAIFARLQDQLLNFVQRVDIHRMFR